MNISKLHVAALSLITCLTFIGPIKHVRAQELTQISAISFGTFAIMNNTAPRSLTVDPNNNVSGDPFIVVDIDPARGEYLLTNQDPNRALDISVTNGTLTLNDSGSGNSMTISAFTTNNPSTDINGDATIYLGATLTTSGNSSGYSDGIFEDNNMSMVINYQ